MSEELKPCPFCGDTELEGGRPFLLTRLGKAWIIRCGNPQCGAEMERLERDNLINAWNRRADAADAERYRWLRHGDNDELVLTNYEPGFIIDGVPKSFLPRGDKLDAAIDTEMQAETGRAL